LVFEGGTVGDLTTRGAYVKPDSALVQAADDLLSRHTAQPGGVCPSCGQLSPCPSARHAVEVRRAAGLSEFDAAAFADAGLGGPSVVSGGGPGPGLRGGSLPGTSLPGPGTNSGSFAAVAAGPGPVALSKVSADDT
jgi:hypothetical protein